MRKLVAIGNHTYGEPIYRGEGNNIIIGNYCSIAEGVIMDGGFGHNTHNISTFPFHTLSDTVPSNILIKGDILIGSDVWLGEQSVIMSGVTIGHGAVIGMRCIVSKDVKPYEVVVGAPQKVLRKRFDDYTIARLLELKWWDLPEKEVIKIAPLLMSNEVEELFKLYNL